MNVKGDGDNCQEQAAGFFSDVSKFSFLLLITQVLSFVCLFVCLPFQQHNRLVCVAIKT